jgi:glycosyltransferase involved in cell wall biosynthesis
VEAAAPDGGQPDKFSLLHICDTLTSLDMPQRIVAVIPCYNASFRCADVIARTASFADSILAIDDGSTDDTAEHLRATGCMLLQLPVNGGKGAALAAGFREVLKGPDGLLGSRVDYVVTIDGDGQHDPTDIPRLVDCARRSGAALVLGMRNLGAMPRKNSIGAHYSRLLFLIGTSTFVADTQSGFRLLSSDLLSQLIDRVRWKGYESESEMLWRTIELNRPIAAVEISTIYIDSNPRSQFDPWRDSTRIASVFTPQLRWTVGMAMLDFAVFGALVLSRSLGPVWANVASRLVAVACQATFRQDYWTRTKRLARAEGLGWYLLTFGGHLGLTTSLLAIGSAVGLPSMLAKALAQLIGYLTTFAIVDQVLLRKSRLSWFHN